MTTSRKYSQELRERAVRMVFAVHEETGERRGGVARVAGQLGINKETLAKVRPQSTLGWNESWR